jgi:hypothetical protein
MSVDEETLREILSDSRLEEVDRHAKLDEVLQGEGCQRAYSSETGTSQDCVDQTGFPTRKRNYVTITECPDPSDNRIVYGNWYCTGAP